MSEFDVTMTVTVRVKINDQNVVDRCVNDEDGWRTRMFYPLDTQDKVLEHLAYNRIANGFQDLGGGLDGWADLPRTAAEMDIEDVVYEMVEVVG